jgi:hypothetical protein
LAETAWTDTRIPALEGTLDKGLFRGSAGRPFDAQPAYLRIFEYIHLMI